MSDVKVVIEDLSSGVLVVRDGADGKGEKLCEVRPGDDGSVLFERIADVEKARDALIQVLDIIKLLSGKVAADEMPIQDSGL